MWYWPLVLDTNAVHFSADVMRLYSFPMPAQFHLPPNVFFIRIQQMRVLKQTFASIRDVSTHSGRDETQTSHAKIALLKALSENKLLNSQRNCRYIRVCVDSESNPALQHGGDICCFSIANVLIWIEPFGNIFLFTEDATPGIIDSNFRWARAAQFGWLERVANNAQTAGSITVLSKCGYLCLWSSDFGYAQCKSLFRTGWVASCTSVQSRCLWRFSNW